jgi:hypothetical protein
MTNVSKNKYGSCCICGSEGKLSFEHVPPRAAFNNHRVLTANINELISKWDGELQSIKGKFHQRGSGSYTLCEKCNTKTGAWYGKAFVDWSYQAFRLISLTKGKPTLYYHFRIFPLRVIKQIICMFFSVNGPKFHVIHPDLVKFIMNPEDRSLRPEIRIYCYFNLSLVSRQSGVAGLLNLDNRKIHTFSEITKAPLGYVMTLESEVPDNRPVDISIFANYRYNDWKELYFQIPILPVYTYLPADYRSREEILEKIRENKNNLI